MEESNEIKVENQEALIEEKNIMKTFKNLLKEFKYGFNIDFKKHIVSFNITAPEIEIIKIENENDNLERFDIVAHIIQHQIFKRIFNPDCDYKYIEADNNLYTIPDFFNKDMLKNNERVTTFSVAKIVLQEHFDNHIQIVMLSKTNHELVHANKLYIHPNQAWGDINAFIEKYKDGMTADQIKTYNDIVEIAEKNNSSS